MAGAEVQKFDCFRECCNTAGAVRAMCYNRWDSLGAPDSHFVSEEMEFSFVQSGQEADNERWLVEMLDWMHAFADRLANKLY